MRWGVITFPGSCDDQDVIDSLKLDLDQKVKPLWHKDELAGNFEGKQDSTGGRSGNHVDVRVPKRLDKTAADGFGVSRATEQVELLNISIAVFTRREQEMSDQQCAALLEEFQ